MASFSFQEGKREECGIIAVFSKKGEDVAPYLYRALMALQHRGQDAAGFAVLGKEGIVARRGLGLVSDIFTEADLAISGSLGIGHTRYPTTGRCLIQDVQPSVINGICVAHNGHIANYDEVKSSLETQGYRFEGTVDSEPIAFLLDSQIKNEKSIEEAVRHVISSLDGAYSDVAIIDGKLVVFRDPHAIRPLVWGEDERFISFASESCALDVNNIPCLGVVEGGELVTLGKSMERKTLEGKEKRHCMFEYVYFSRPDSIINGKEVHEVRRRLGAELAAEHPADADLVVPVPDTSRTAAETYARFLSLPVEEALIKNRYIGRTFIMPNQQLRRGKVRLKLNPVKSLISGKRVALIDDSIVRGTTLKEIVAMVRDAGAREVHVRITCPPLKAPCFYGVDMKSYDELIANGKSVGEVAKFIGADSLGYLSLDGLRRAIGLPICTGCLNEDYVTPYAKKLARQRKDENLSCG